MKSYEIIVMLLLVFLGVIIITNLFSIERPSLAITDENNTQNGFGENLCEVTASAKVTNLGGPAKEVMVRVNVLSQAGSVIETKELEAGDMDKNQFSLVSGTIEVNGACTLISNVVFSISSFK